MISKCHSIIITGNVQDIGFRSVIEHIGRSFGMPGMVFNSKDGSVKILCSGEDRVIENFTHTIKARGEERGAVISDIINQTLPVNIDLPEDFAKASSDEDIDIGRKLDKGNDLLTTLILDNRDSKKDMNTGFNNLSNLMSEHNAHTEEHNTRMEEHNTRLEAILQKLADKT